MMGLEGVKERRLLEDRGVVILSKCLEDLFLNPKARFPHPFFQRSSGGPAFRFQSQLVIGIPGRNSNRLCRLIGKLDSARIDTDVTESDLSQTLNQDSRDRTDVERSFMGDG